MPLDSHKKLVPNEPHVAHERIDKEVVVIHFDSGTYFSLDGVAGVLWELLSPAGSVETLATWAAERGIEREKTLGFAQQLVTDGLAREGEATPADAAAAAPFLDELREVTGEPEIRKFTDMQDLLMADPIH